MNKRSFLVGSILGAISLSPKSPTNNQQISAHDTDIQKIESMFQYRRASVERDVQVGDRVTVHSSKGFYTSSVYQVNDEVNELLGYNKTYTIIGVHEPVPSYNVYKLSHKIITRDFPYSPDIFIEKIDPTLAHLNGDDVIQLKSGDYIFIVRRSVKSFEPYPESAPVGALYYTGEYYFTKRSDVTPYKLSRNIIHFTPDHIAKVHHKMILIK